MKVKLQPSLISGEVSAPPSKSAMQRACALALLQEGKTIIHNPGKSEDDLAALGVIRNFGALIAETEGTLVIRSPGINTGAIEDTGYLIIDCGESGLCVRMFTPIATLYEREIRIMGRGSLLGRPLDLFTEIFPELGIEIQSDQGKLPLRVKGPMVPKNITINGSLSSQFLTGLLLAFAKAATTPVTIQVTNLKSKPYIDLTLEMMRLFGYLVTNDRYEEFRIGPRVPGHGTIVYRVEGDWSGASFLLVAGAIAGRLTLKGLDLSSFQADRKILKALELAGAELNLHAAGISVSPAVLKAFTFDATDCPDLFPPLVVLAAYCTGVSVIEGTHRLVHKESNRALALKSEFAKMGLTIELTDDSMKITGNRLHGAEVDSHHDHRIAMAVAVAALKAEGETVICNAEAVNKSYPDFFAHLKMLGATVSLPSNQ